MSKLFHRNKVAIPELDVWAYELSAHDVIELQKIEGLNGPEILAKSIFDNDGKPAFASVDEAKPVSLGVFTQLMTAINQVNGWDTEKKV